MSFSLLSHRLALLVSRARLIRTSLSFRGTPDDALLVHKAHSEHLQPLPLRKQILSSFVNLINPSLEYEIVAIKDVYGPTATDPDIQALVLSQETVAGGEASESSLFWFSFLGEEEEVVKENEADLDWSFLLPFLPVAKHRKEHDLSSLHTFIISVISHTTDEDLGDDGKKMKEAKMSSTFIREWIASKAEKKD